MALFFIVALKDSAPAIEAAIAAKFSPENYYKVEPGKWIVDTESLTAKDVSTVNLVLPATAWHFIVSFRGYYGRAQPDMWEWLAAKSAKG